ncbi:MAG: MBL fold metallo-hydrolase [Microlunatus sp.]
MSEIAGPFHAGPFRRVAEHTYVATAGFSLDGESGEINVGLVVGTEAALLVDAGGTVDQGRLLREAAAEITELPLTTVVLTHGHADHAHGLAGVEAATSIAHESTRNRLALDPAAPALPSRVISLAAAIDLGGGVRVEAIYLGRGHTDGDLVVVVPDVHVVFAGDLVESAGPPQYGPDSYPHEWPATLDGLIGLTLDHSIVIPGHGPAMNRLEVFEQRSRIAAVSGEMSRLGGLGVSADEAEGRAEWALPFAAVRQGYAAGVAQAKAATPVRHLPMV